MDSSLLVMVVLGVAVLGLLLGALVVVAAIAIYMRGRGGDPTATRSEGLAKLGFDGRPDGTWVYPIQGTQMVFSEGPAGLQWQLRLPRYNTMTLHLAEAESGAQVEDAFESGIYAVDQRFRLGSPQPDRVVALLGQAKLQKALLRLPNLALRLSADELLIEDPGKAGVAKIDRPDPIDAELDEHALVINVVNALFGSLYEETGTVMDQYR